MQPIVFLSDYGLADPFVGMCHAVIERVCPGAKVIDLTHDIATQDVRQGALVLADSLPWLTTGVHLGVVDPGVGTARRPLILVAGDRLLVGPDNGLLWPAAQALGGPSAAFEIAPDPVASRTFHGRDIFAPAAARLASGAAAETLGSPIDPADLVPMVFSEPAIAHGWIEAEILAADRFGNLQLNVTSSQLSEAGFRDGDRVQVGSGQRTHDAWLCGTFGDVEPDALAVYEDSFRRIAVAVNRGSAARRLGIGPGAALTLSA